MDTSDEGSDSEGVASFGVNMNYSALSLAGKSQLKPKLDSIFAEVEKNLPSIDFDLSDVSSDNEEPVIFQRHLIKTYLDDDDKDFDTSLNEQSFSDLFHPAQDNLSFNSNTRGEGDDGEGEALLIYDNDLALQMQNSGNRATVSTGTSVASWTEVVIEARQDSTNFSERPPVKHQNWLEDSEEGLPDLSNALSMMESEMMQRIESPDNLFADDSLSENVITCNKNSEKHERESVKEENVKSVISHPKMDKYLRQEIQRDQEREIVSNMVSAQPVHLNLGRLGSLDIDMVLESMSEDNQLAPPIIQEAWPDVQQRVESVFAGGEGSNKSETNETKTLIERLALMSMAESGVDLTDVDPNTGAHKGHMMGDNWGKPNNDRRPSDDEVKDKWGHTVKRPPTPDSADKDDLPGGHAVETVKKTSSCGTNTADSSNQPPKIIIPRVRSKLPEPSPKKRERDTVFLDLRNFDVTRQEQQSNIERVQRILQIQPEKGDSSDDEDSNVDCWRDVRSKMKSNLSSKGVCTEALPNKPRPSRTYEDARQPQRVIQLSPRPQGQGDSPGTVSEDTEAQLQTRREAEQTEAEKRRKMEEAKKQREQKQSDRQARIRLCKRLDALRPPASVSGKQDSAEITPIVFDIDVSYEPAPRSLPTILQPEHECLLLTIHMSSNGEIILHRGKSKSVDTGIGLSASYTVLLTWLLSFVPDNYNFLQSQASKDQDGGAMYLAPPFYVVGLQQLLLEEQHALVVAVTPTEQFSDRHVPVKVKKSKVRDEMKDSSPFQQHLAKFLSTNTLHSVCPWLQDLVSGEVPSSQVDPVTGNPAYVYRPPLPNITNKPLSTFMQINPDHHAAQKVFNTSVGFFFQTIDNEELCADITTNDSGISYDTQNTMSLIYKRIFQDPRATMGIFNRILQEGLDLAGVRLLYPTPELLNLASGRPSSPTDNSEAKSDLDVLNNIGPVLAVGIRGTFGRTIWLDAVGPSDPSLARRTDPNSLCALYGGSSRDECLLFCPRNQMRVHIELARWFGGRVPPGGVIDVGTPYTKKDNLRSGSPKGRRGKKASFNDSKERDDKPVVMPNRRPPATLTSTTKSYIFLVISPSVGPQCMGVIMATCQRRGYQIRGIRRLQLTAKKACSLGIESGTIVTFCAGTEEGGDGSSFVKVPNTQNMEASLPSTLLLLEKENAAHHAASLIEACMVQLTLQGAMGTIQRTVDFPLNSRQLFHAARYSDSLQAMLGGDLSKCVDYEISVNPSFVVPKLYTNPEVEEFVVLLILGHDNLKSSGLLVGQLVNMVPFSQTPISLPLKEGFDLLGIKWVPSLTLSQAKEVTPFEVGDRQWKDNIHTLTCEPALILVVRGVDGFKNVTSVISHLSSSTGHIDYLMSNTPEEAYSFARSFFTARELHSDPQSRSLLPYLPTIRRCTLRKSKERGMTVQRESIFDLMQQGPQTITTFLLIKPRAVRRHLSKILKKIVQEGFDVTGFRICILDRHQAETLLDTKGMEPELLEKHLGYLTSDPCVCLILERENAVKKLLDLLGPCDPQGARRLSQFYWRGVFGADPVLNALHGSVDYRHAVEEVKRFFPEGVCCKPLPSLQEEAIECPAEDSTMALKFHEKRSVVVHDKQTSGGDNLTDSLHHLLLQTTCIVLKPDLVRPTGKGKSAYADVIDGLLCNGFDIVGARMVWFTPKQAEHFLHVIQAGSYQQVPLLTSGPSLVLALERDNAVVAFDSLLGSNYGSGSLISHYGANIARPSDLKQAHNMLMFFFDKLMPGSQVEIVAQGSKD